MINLAKNTAALKATTTAFSQLNSVGAVVAVKSAESNVVKDPQATTNTTLRKNLTSGAISLTSSITSGTQVRFYHPSKYAQPDFTNYRREWGKNPSPSASTTDKKTPFTYLIAGTAIAASLSMSKATVRSLLSTMAPGPAALAMASIEVDLKNIPEGKSATFKWRGKPIFVRHRTSDEISREQTVNVSELRDPQTDQDRVEKPQWLIVIGVCTHLGCVPIANAGDYGGYYCPCHGSHYDGSGRIRKGPAPLNLEVPPLVYKEENLVVIG
jgi:ubiquinol-cytochrome c reductase iron-sulfur subunit